MMKNLTCILSLTLLNITIGLVFAEDQEIIPEPPKQFNLQELIGNSLTDAQGQTVSPSILKGKWVGLYFAKGGNKTCEEFTRKLVELRNKYAENFEVVYISGDSDQAAMLNSMREMPWPALPFDSEKKSECKASFDINNIPAMVILDPLGLLSFSEKTKKEKGIIYTKKNLDEWFKMFSGEYSFSYFPQPVYIGDGIEPPKDLTIDPGVSIFGCSYGSTEKQVIEKLGSPFGKHSDKMGNSTLFYGIDCSLFFDNGKLCGIKTGPIFNEWFTILDKLGGYELCLFSDANRDPDKIVGWKLKNGVHHKMNLSEAQSLCGFECDDLHNEISWEQNGQIINFQIAQQDNLQLIESIKVMPKNDNENATGYKSPFNIPCDPAKSIYGCDLGLSQNEVMKNLGNPIAQLNLGKNKTGLVYNQGRSLLLFWDNKLGGGIFQPVHTEGPFGWETNPNDPFSNLSCLRKSTTEVLPFIIKNSIGCGQQIAYAKGMLGDKLKTFNSDSGVDRYIYKDGQSVVVLESIQNPSHGISEETPIFYENAGSFGPDFKPLEFRVINTIRIIPDSELYIKNK